MASARRIEQLSNLIREIVAGILVENFTPPVGALVTVIRAVISDDLQYARIFVSVLGGGEDAEATALGELTRRSGAIQRRLNQKLRMRPVPKITFSIDTAEKKRERVEKLLGEGGNEIDATPIL
jgi:ribosome-binding factor A